MPPQYANVIIIDIYQSPMKIIKSYTTVFKTNERPAQTFAPKNSFGMINSGNSGKFHLNTGTHLQPYIRTYLTLTHNHRSPSARDIEKGSEQTVD